MAIEFESNQDNKQQESLQTQENILAEKEGRKPKKIKVKKTHKTAMQRLSSFLLTMSIIGLIYSILFSISGLISLIPSLILWLTWLLMVIVSTIFTLGIVWGFEGWKSFNSGFIDFNKAAANSTISVVNFLNNSFVYFAIGFAVFMLIYLIMKIVNYNNHKGEKKFKSQLIWTIVMVVVFVVFIIIDIFFLQNVKLN